MDEKELRELEEKQLTSELMFEGRLLHVYRDNVRLPDGAKSTREYITHMGAVCMVAVTDDRKVIMERQYRYPIHQVLTEIPAGKLDSPDEDPLEAAKRELEEETGYTAENWLEIGEIISVPAYSEEKVTIFLATGLSKGKQRLDDEEFINVFEAPLDDLVEDIMAGRIRDGKTISALLKADRILRED